MAKASVSERNAERTVQAVNHNVDWMRQLMEESLNQTRSMFEGFVMTARRTTQSFEQQTSEMRERSISLATEAFGNTMNFAQQAMRIREPQELFQLQSDFMSQQAQAFAEQSKLLTETMARGANEVGRMTSRNWTEASRKRAEAG
jgi:hypothetical protein